MGGGHSFPPVLTCDYNRRAPDKFKDVSESIFFFFVPSLVSHLQEIFRSRVKWNLIQEIVKSIESYKEL